MDLELNKTVVEQISKAFAFFCEKQVAVWKPGPEGVYGYNDAWSNLLILLIQEKLPKCLHWGKNYIRQQGHSSEETYALGAHSLDGHGQSISVQWIKLL